MKRLSVLATAILIVGQSSFADMVTLNLNNAYSNYTPGDLAYSAEYGIITLEEIGNDVQFSIDIAGYAGGPNADIHLLYFNMASFNSGLALSIDPNFLYGIGENTFKADGDGYYDVRVDFGSGSAGGSLQDVSFFALNSMITDFLAYDLGGSKGDFTMTVHLQTTSTAPGSEFVGANPGSSSVPEPATLVLLGSAILSLGLLRRKVK